MILQAGDKLLVVHRRLFLDDPPRFFVGSVDRYEAGIAVVHGHTWIRDILAGDYHRKADLRTKILSIISGGLLIYLLPEEVEIHHLTFTSKGASVLVSDGREFFMDLTEYAIHPVRPESIIGSAE